MQCKAQYIRNWFLLEIISWNWFTLLKNVCDFTQFLISFDLTDFHIACGKMKNLLLQKKFRQINYFFSKTVNFMNFFPNKAKMGVDCRNFHTRFLICMKLTCWIWDAISTKSNWFIFPDSCGFTNWNPPGAWSLSTRFTETKSKKIYDFLSDCWRSFQNYLTCGLKIDISWVHNLHVRFCKTSFVLVSHDVW